jgi:hypothetical protein
MKKKLTEDYPVTGHNRVSKKGKRHAVIPHDRGEKKKQVLAKVEKIKKQPSEKNLGNYGLSKKYPGKLIRIVKGRPYIEYKSATNIKGRGTAKAINIGGVWIPRSQVWFDSPHPKYAHVYVSEWFYPKLERKEAEAELESLDRQIESTEFSLTKSRKRLENLEKDRFTTEKPENIQKYIKEDEDYLKAFQKLKKGLLQKIRTLSLDSLGITINPVVTEIITPVIKRDDSIPFSEFKQIKTDFNTEDFVIFHGPIARDGPYEYRDNNGNPITLHKDIDNLSDIYSRYKYLPIRASEKPGAHHAEELGYATNFSLNKNTNEIEADLVLVNDSKFKKILKKKKKYHVSPGYADIVKNNIQIITDLDHVALALGTEISRACTGTNTKGSSCTTVDKIHDQNLMEVV